MRWLRGFFRTDDPILKLIAGLGEPEALMRKELLENAGIPALTKNVDGVAIAYQMASGCSFDLYVKRSDLERAAEVLGPLLDAASAEDRTSRGSG